MDQRHLDAFDGHGFALLRDDFVGQVLLGGDCCPPLAKSSSISFLSFSWAMMVNFKPFRKSSQPADMIRIAVGKDDRRNGFVRQLADFFEKLLAVRFSIFSVDDDNAILADDDGGRTAAAFSQVNIVFELLYASPAGRLAPEQTQAS